jgi:hypothetical protein
MNFNNKYLVLILIIVIIFIFVYNYDVYVIEKNKQLCKPILITKHEINSENNIGMNDNEKIVFKEAFTNLMNSGYYETFDNSNVDDINNIHENLINFKIPTITDPKKKKVISSVIAVIANIPTSHSENDIKQIIEYFAIIYQTSNSLENFYSNIEISTKINEVPYNTQFAHLILFLIGKFNTDLDNCSVDNAHCISELPKILKDDSDPIKNNTKNVSFHHHPEENRIIDNNRDIPKNKKISKKKKCFEKCNPEKIVNDISNDMSNDMSNNMANNIIEPFASYGTSNFAAF